MGIRIMGIVNVTADSFYPPSRFLDGRGTPETDRIVRRVGEMLREGADIIDIGAVSTRPGASIPSEAEEWRRLEPCLRAVREAFPGLGISIDTFRSGIVRRAVESIGPFIVNDIFAGSADVQMLPLVGRLGLPYVAMHIQGTPETMHDSYVYEDVTAAVVRYFEDFSARAEDNGIKEWILDPGFGFSKNVDQSLALLHSLDAFKVFTRPVLVGISRKRMTRPDGKSGPEEALRETERLQLEAIERGADILRVHDVAAAAKLKTIINN